jgi:Ca-activated chloride channel family protein
MDRTGTPVISSLSETALRELAAAGNGTYQTANYRDGDTRKILDQVKAQALPETDDNERTRVWNERFYWLAGLALLLLLPRFRRTIPTYRHSE